jgi:hypothetical protein
MSCKIFSLSLLVSLVLLANTAHADFVWGTTPAPVIDGWTTVDFTVTKDGDSVTVSPLDSDTYVSEGVVVDYFYRFDVSLGNLNGLAITTPSGYTSFSVANVRVDGESVFSSSPAWLAEGQTFYLADDGQGLIGNNVVLTIDIFGISDTGSAFSILVASVPPTLTPEPATMLILGLGIAGLGIARRRMVK